jgi:hypothetical protein
VRHARHRHEAQRDLAVRFAYLKDLRDIRCMRQQGQIVCRIPAATNAVAIDLLNLARSPVDSMVRRFAVMLVCITGTNWLCTCGRV